MSDIGHDALIPDADGENSATGFDSQFPGSTSRMSEDEIATKFPNRPQNHSETLKFHELYLTLFDPLAENKKKKTGIGLRGRKDLKPHEVRRQIIDNFIARWRNEVGNDIFPAFRLILCDKDRDRNVYVS